MPRMQPTFTMTCTKRQLFENELRVKGQEGTRARGQKSTRARGHKGIFSPLFPRFLVTDVCQAQIWEYDVDIDRKIDR